jgi:hypothetical protein
LSDIFEEVDESIRNDRVAELWKKYGAFVWAAAIALVLAVALRVYLNDRAAAAKDARAAEFESALELLEAGNYSAAKDALSAMVAADTPLSPLAAHYLARAEYEGSGDAGAAADVLIGAAANKDDPYGRIALLKAVYLESADLSLAEVRERLASLVGLQSPLGTLARELVAAKAYEAGEVAFARTEFNRLLFDANAPEGLKRRARVALEAMPPAPAEAAVPDMTETSSEAPSEPSDDTPEKEETAQ